MLLNFFVGLLKKILNT
jgi:hypothetical protein